MIELIVTGVDTALPIEPIYASGLFSNGFLCEAEGPYIIIFFLYAICFIELY